MDDTVCAIIILEGERGLGKTSACLTVAGLVGGRSLRVAGFLSESRRDAFGLPIEVNLRNLSNGEVNLLATRGENLGGPRWPPESERGFSFSDEAFSQALGQLFASIEMGPSKEARHPGLVILDEIGPVELELGLGFMPFVAATATASREGRRLPPILFTTRPSLAGRLAALFPEGRATRCALDVKNREAMPARIASLL